MRANLLKMIYAEFCHISQECHILFKCCLSRDLLKNVRGTTFPVNFPPTIQTNKNRISIPTFDVIQNEKWLNTAAKSSQCIFRTIHHISDVGYFYGPFNCEQSE